MDIRGGAKDEIGVKLPLARVRELRVLMRLYVEVDRVELLVRLRRALIGKIGVESHVESARSRMNPGNIAREKRNAHASGMSLPDEVPRPLLDFPQIDAEVDFIHAMRGQKIKTPRRLGGIRGIFAAPPPDALGRLGRSRSCEKANRKKDRRVKNP